MKETIKLLNFIILISLNLSITKENISTNEIILNPDETYSSGYSKSTPSYFIIKLDDIENIQNVNIYFTVLSGNADIYIYSDAEHKILIQKKNLRYAYKKEIIEIYENFLQNYISLVLHESSFIEIKYDINSYEKEKMLLNNEVNIEYLNKEENYKKYIIKSEYENNYLLIKSLDCSLNFKNGEKEDKNITYKYYEFTGEEYSFNLKLENYFHTVSNDTEDCTVFISTGVNPNSKSDPLIIQESIPNPTSFTNTYYKFPFIYDEYFNGIFINIDLDFDSVMESSTPPEIKITFIIGDQQTDYETYTIYKSKTFFIKSTIEKYCKSKNICNLLVQLEREDSSSQLEHYTIYTTIQLSTLSPIYINKNQVYNEKLSPLGYKYFYTQIDQDEEGEINIIFNKGSGKIFAKIVEKNTIEKDPDWNRRINLPKETSDNLLDFDSIHGSLKYYTNEFNNCLLGCELYILIKGYETIDNDDMFNDFTFSIDKKRNGIGQNSVVNLLLNNYVKGNLTQDVYKYYTFTINFDIKKISINFYTQVGKLYIKLGKGLIANEENYDWELIRYSDKDNRIIISCDDEIIGKNTLNGLSFSLGIIQSNSYIDKENINTFYFLQVQTLHDDLINYYYLHSERSILCNTNEYEYCYVLLPLSDLNNNQNTLIYASSTTNYNSKINILSKFYSEEEIDKISYTQSITGKFPTKLNCEQNSNGEKYLLLDNNKVTKNNYVFLTIDANEKNSLIKILVSPSANLLKTSLPPFTERLIWANTDQNIDFTILDTTHLSDSHFLNINTLTGVSELILGDNDYYSEINGNYINEISLGTKIPMQINNRKGNSEPRSMIISYSKKKGSNNEYNLYKNINNEISFSLTENPFPQFGYIEMREKSVKINIYFYDILFKEYSRSTIRQNLFNIYSMLITEDGPIDVAGYYLLYENIGIIDLKFNNSFLKENPLIDVYSFIERSYGNENVYKKIKEQITVSETDNNGITLFPKSKYFYSLNNNDSKINLILTNTIKNNKIILIDIAQNLPVLNNLKYTFEKSDSISMKTYDYMGKKRILLQSTNTEGIDNLKLTIEKDVNNSSTPSNFTIQYYSFSDISSIIEYKNFDNLFYIQELEDNRKNIVFKNILHYYNNSLSNVVYFIDIFNKTEEFDSYGKIDTVFLGNGESDYNNVVYSTIIDWLKYDYESYAQYIPSNLDYTKDKYLIRIVASFINSNGYEERIIYVNEKKEDKKEEEEEDKNKENSYSLNIFIGFIIVLVIIGIIIIVINYLKNKKKIKLDNENENIEPIANLEDSKNDELIGKNK